ncbi:nitroreductase family protein [Candidatus Altiarchaeota archaeon]
MDVKDAIDARRAYRSLAPAEITRELVEDLAISAGLAPSCFNKQPWRFVFTYDEKTLKQLHEALPEGNAWVKYASMIITVFSKKEDDCIIEDRVYNMFDTGMACALLMLRATELGLVAHPIAGYDPEKVRDVLGIPEEYQIITLINAGKHSEKIPDYLSEYQAKTENVRPERKTFDEYCSIGRFTP